MNENNKSNGGSPFIITKNPAGESSDFFQNEHLFKLMVESAAEYAIFALDAQGEIVNWNAGAERIFGYVEAEIKGRRLAALFPDDDRENGAPEQEMTKARLDGSAEDDRWLVKKSGERFWASGRLMALKDDGGADRGFVKIVRDQTERKRLEESLNSFETRFREIIRQSPLSTFVLDTTGRVKYVNPAFTKLWGLGLEDLTAYNPLEDEQAEALGIKPYIERAFAGEASAIPPICYDPKQTASVGEGNVCWIKAFAYPIKNDAGGVLEVVIVHEDVSNQIRIEKDLVSSRERLALAQQIGKAGSFDWNIRDDINVWSPELERLFGIEPGTFEQNLDGWKKRVVSEDAESVLDTFVKAFEHQQTDIEGEFQVRLPDNKRRWLQSRSRIEYDERGEPLRAVGICLDITERKKSEEELRLSRERYEALVKASSQIVWTTDVSGAIIDDSKGWRDFTGQSYDEWRGFGWLDALHPDDRDRANRAWKEAVEKQELYEVEYRLKNRNGEYRWTAARGVPIKDESGRIREWVGMNTDITERREAEEALRRSEEKYRTLFETIDEGFCLIELIFDANGNPVDYRFLEVNNVFEQQTGLINAQGKTVLEILPRLESWWIETYGKVALTGESIRFENSSDAMNRWFDVYATRVGDDASRTVALVFKDITERKRREVHLFFLSEFSQELISLARISETMKVFGEKVHRLMNASVCTFIEINEAKDEATVNHEWRQADNFSLIGRYELSQFVTREFLETMSGGKAVIVRDVAGDSRIENRENFDAINIGSFINVPLISDGDWKFVLGVYHEKPYDWQPDEVALMLEAANRIWTKIERTRAEDALRESHTRREFVLESSKIGEWEIDLATGKALRTLIHDQCFGAAEAFDDWSYEIFLSHVHPDDRAEVKRKFDESIAEEKEWDFECRVVWADESIHWIRAQGNFYHDEVSEKPNRMVGIVTEITRQKEAEREREELIARELSALKQSEVERQKLESLFKQSPAIINIMRGADHVFDLVHPRMPELLGAHDYQGKAVKEILPEPEYEPFIELMNHVYQTGETYFGNDTPIWLNTPKGRREGYFDFIYQAWRDIDGKIGGVLSLGIEVTERVLARQTMERAAEEREAMLEREQQLRKTAEDASRLKDEFLATVSHELRTPLNAIIGWSQMMRSGIVKADQYDKAIETIDRNARSQAQLIDDLLDITRIITGKLRLNLDETNFASVINSAVQTVRPAAQAKNIQLFVNLSSEQADILGDAERLQQVVWNLISNAVKFTPKSGEIFVTLEMKGSHLKLSVRDTGEGIEPEFLPFVFDRFSQADMSSTRRMGGLGLGLSIVRHLVEMHGGAVSVSSEGKGSGTTFTVVLPVNIDRQEDQAEIARATHYPDAAGNAPTARLDGVKVLVVDDEPDACEVLKILLEQCGALVTTANSASEAFDCISVDMPNILVSDIAMPDEDGYALIKKIRSLPKEKGGNITAIALTAYASQTDRKKALEAGFQSHVTKPVDQNALVTILASLV